MKQIISKILILCFSLIFLCTNSFAGTPPTPTLAPMLQKVLPAIVNVKALIKITDLATLNRLQKENAGNGDQVAPDQFISVGSGVIVDANKGYILTNAHVINDAQTVTITLNDKRHYTAKVIGVDKPSDIALLQIFGKKLTAIPMSDSNTLKVGDYVAAIGSPYDLNQTVTSGIISALGRATLGIENYENFIQTDTPINPGNSGGALINMNGQLVGINTAILAPNRGSIGIGFAITSNIAKSVMLQLIEFGNVKRGALGVGVQDITPDLESAFNITHPDGAAVTIVMPNSPAEQAGIQIGDIIISINGTEITNANDVVNSIAFLRVDSKATIKVLRNNKLLTLTTNVYDPQKAKMSSQEKDPYLYGLGLKNFSITSPLHGDVKGVLIVSIQEDSNAWRADLHTGDVITSANQEKVTNIAELRKIAANSEHALLLNVLRSPGALFLVINKEEPPTPQS